MKLSAEQYRDTISHAQKMVSDLSSCVGKDERIAWVDRALTLRDELNNTVMPKNADLKEKMRLAMSRLSDEIVNTLHNP